MVTNDAGLISGLLLCICGETEVVKAGCFFLFSRRWITNLVTHRKINVQTLSGETM